MRTWAPAVLLIAVAACSGKVATVSDSTTTTPDAGPPSQEPDAGLRTTKACEAVAGVCLPKDFAAPPNRSPVSGLCQGTDLCWVVVPPPTPAGCAFDAECNANPGMSALAGQCFHGLCICNPPFHIQPNGKCDKNPPPDCMTQAGKCRQNPATCQPGELEADITTDMSCGDLVPAVCCFPASSCKSPVDLVCCGASTTPYEPTCENGWKSCSGGGPTPRLRQDGCK